jgi:hypothetical protein
MKQDMASEQEAQPGQDASSSSVPYEPPEVVRSLPFDSIVLADPFCVEQDCTTLDPDC